MNLILNKRHIILAALVLALSIAVYLNFVLAGRDSDLIEAGAQDPNISAADGKNYGDTQLVDGQNVGNADEIDTTYFDEARLSRTRARDEAIETLQEIFADSVTDEEQLAVMTMKAVSLAQSIEVEDKIETLIKSKGFADCLVYVSESKADVIIKTEGLLANEAAVIKDIIVGETSLEADNIKILEVK